MGAISVRRAVYEADQHIHARHALAGRDLGQVTNTYLVVDIDQLAFASR